MNQKLKSTKVVVVIALALAAAAAGPAVAADVNFEGKTITLYIGGGIGKGIDNYGRTLIRYMNRYLPGDPSIVASNMPGAGGVQGLQYLYNRAAKDGTAFGTSGSSPFSGELMPKGKVNFDIPKFRWIGSLVRGDIVCGVWHTSSIKTLDDVKTHEVSLSMSGPAEANPVMLMNALLGTRFKPIIGYNATSPLLAVERGEVEGTCPTVGTLRMTRPTWLTQKEFRPIVRVSMDADSNSPDVSRVVDLLKDDDEKEMFELLVFPHEFGAPFMLPPGTQDDVLATYRKAFDATVRDPAYQIEAKRQGQAIEPRNGAEVTALIERVFATPKPIIQRTVKTLEAR
jgi:tripartite-type tricarboxylate transporter receptor subunit TctC